MRVLRTITVLMLLGCVTGCTPAREDAEDARERTLFWTALEGLADATEAAAALQACSSPECVQRHGGALARVVDRTSRAIDEGLAAIEDPCMADVGATYLRLFRTYGSAALHAQAGQTREMRSTLNRRSDLALAASDRLQSCDRSLAGRQLAVVLDMRAATMELYVVDAALSECRRPACIRGQGDRMARTAKRAMTRSFAVLETLSAIPVPCHEAFEGFAHALAGFRGIGRAARRLDRRRMVLSRGQVDNSMALYTGALRRHCVRTPLMPLAPST